MKDKEAHNRLDLASDKYKSLESRVSNVESILGRIRLTHPYGHRAASEQWVHSGITDLRRELTDRIEKVEQLVADLSALKLAMEHIVEGQSDV